MASVKSSGVLQVWARHDGCSLPGLAAHRREHRVCPCGGVVREASRSAAWPRARRRDASLPIPTCREDIAIEAACSQLTEEEQDLANASRAAAPAITASVYWSERASSTCFQQLAPRRLPRSPQSMTFSPTAAAIHSSFDRHSNETFDSVSLSSLAVG